MLGNTLRRSSLVRTTLCSSAALLALVSCGGSQGLEPRYVAVHNTMTAVGLAQTGSISEGSLAQGADARVNVTLNGGECTTFVALGSGISNIDVRVIGEGDEELGTDGTNDPHAATQICAPRSGDFQVVVTATEGSGGYILSSWSGTAVASSGPSAGGTRPVVASSGTGTCAEPLPIAFNQPANGTTAQNQHVMAGSCVSGGAAPEVVYQLTIENRAMVRIALESQFDGALYVLGTCGNMGTEIACNDDAGDTNHSLIETTLEPGTYFVVVDGYGSESGSYDLAITETALQTVADRCTTAPVLSPGAAVTASTQGSADYFQATCAGGARSPDLVHQIVVPQRSRLRVRQQTSFDGALYVRRACDDPNTEIACNDDFASTSESLVTAVVDPGTYFVYSDGFSGQNARGGAGNVTLTASLGNVNGGGATGDSCSSPATPGQGVFPVDTIDASDTTLGSCGGQGGADVIYELNLTGRSTVEVKVRDAEFAGAMYIQSTCGDRTSEEACAPIASSDPRSQESTMTATLGRGRYFLVIDGERPDAFGAANVEVNITDIAALERSCRRAPMLRPGRTVNGNTTNEQDNFQASCAGGAASNDVLYRLRVARRSVVRIDLSADYDAALHLRRDCADQSTEVACNDDHQDNRHSRIESTLDAGTYFVIVDGFRAGNAGSYSLEVDVSRP